MKVPCGREPPGFNRRVDGLFRELGDKCINGVSKQIKQQTTTDVNICKKNTFKSLPG